MLREYNVLGQTTFHLAVGNQECLRLLLAATKETSLFDEIDNHGQTPLACALYLSGRKCKNRTAPSQCTDCICSQSILLLLEAGASLHLFRDGGTSQPGQTYYLQGFLSQASERGKWTYAEYVKQQREVLKAFALQSLPRSTWAVLGLTNPDVLDAKIPGVVQALNEQGTEIPDFAENFKTGTYEDPGYYLLLYMLLGNPHDADIFWDLGFRDTCLPLFPGYGHDGYNSLNYLYWLHNHGVNFHSPIIDPSLDGRISFRAHLVLYELGYSLSFDDSWVGFGNKHWFHHILTNVQSESTLSRDNCQCRCTRQGCTSLTFLLKGFQARTIRPLPVGSPPITFLRHSKGIFERVHHQEVLRLVTFQAFQLPHTCCYPRHDCLCHVPYPLNSSPSSSCQDGRCRWKPQCSEELSEIEAEHRFEFACFEKLLGELETELEMILENPKKSNEDILNFWQMV